MEGTLLQPADYKTILILSQLLVTEYNSFVHLTVVWITLN